MGSNPGFSAEFVATREFLHPLSLQPHVTIFQAVAQAAPNKCFQGSILLVLSVLDATIIKADSFAQQYVFPHRMALTLLLLADPLGLKLPTEYP